MSTTDAGIRQLKNGNWAYRFSISVNGQKISQRGSTNSEGQPLKTKTDAIKARKKAIKLAQLAPSLPVKEKEPEKLTVAQVFEEYREKGRSDRAYLPTQSTPSACSVERLSLSPWSSRIE